MTKLVLAFLVGLIAVSVLQKPTPAYRVPARDAGINHYIEIPVAYRQRNWTNPQGHGSCVHASMVMLLRWQRMPELADWWKNQYAGGETWSSFTPKVDAARLKWAGTYRENNVAFLQWAVDTRRGCMVTVDGGAHMILLVGLDENTAYLLDNNTPDTIIRKPRDEFLQNWYGAFSWALTPCYNPPPPVLKGLK